MMRGRGVLVNCVLQKLVCGTRYETSMMADAYKQLWGGACSFYPTATHIYIYILYTILYKSCDNVYILREQTVGTYTLDWAFFFFCKKKKKKTPAWHTFCYLTVERHVPRSRLKGSKMTMGGAEKKEKNIYIWDGAKHKNTFIYYFKTFIVI